MVLPLRRSLPVPAAAFALLLGAALSTVAVARSSPRSGLVGAVGDFAWSASRGDPDRALAHLEGGSSDPRVRAWVLERRGLLGQIVGLDVSPDGREGRVEMAWIDASSLPRSVEVQRWVRRADGGWGLASIEVLGPRLR